MVDFSIVYEEHIIVVTSTLYINLHPHTLLYPLPPPPSPSPHPPPETMVCLSESSAGYRSPLIPPGTAATRRVAAGVWRLLPAVDPRLQPPVSGGWRVMDSHQVDTFSTHRLSALLPPS